MTVKRKVCHTACWNAAFPTFAPEVLQADPTPVQPGGGVREAQPDRKQQRDRPRGPARTRRRRDE
jgi:hypothetical protein